MGSPYQDYDLVLSAPTAVEAEMAKDLLESNGIPCLLHGRDRDMAELGVGVHNALTRPDLFVPKGKGERAKSILATVWTERPIEPDAPIDVGPRSDPVLERRKVPLSWLAIAMLLAFAVLAILLARTWLVDFAAS